MLRPRTLGWLTLAVLTACSAANVDNVPDIAEHAEAQRYLEHFAEQSVDGAKQMASVADQGSSAEQFALYEREKARVFDEADVNREPFELAVDAKTAELCTSDRCSTVADVTAAGDRVFGFNLDGAPLHDGFVEPFEAGETDGYALTLLGGFAHARGELELLLEVKAGRLDLSFEPGSAEYVRDDGHRITAANAVGPTRIRPNGSGVVLVTFYDANTSGKVLISGSDAEYHYAEWEVPVEIERS